MDSLIGKTINGYAVQGVIGRGGMATVYSAVQMSMNRTVALKVLPKQYVSDDTYLQRFNREVAIASKLEHRNIIPVYDYGEFETQPYIVMRYMPAGSIDGLIARGALSLEHTLDILRQIAPALDYAHSKSVLHRDLKPSNVLLDDDGGAYLTDFGIARIIGEASGSTITTQGVIGTPAYMSPEQAQGKTLDHRSDIYALGIMLFEMLTGRRPFESDTPYGVAVLQVTTPPPAPRSYNEAIPVSVENVLYRVLSKQPENRYSSAESLHRAFRTAVEQFQQLPDTEPSIVSRYEPSPATALPVTMPPPAAFNPHPAYAQQPSHVDQGSERLDWSQPVKPKRRIKRRREGSNLWFYLLLGPVVGCIMLTLLVAAAAVMLGRMDDLLRDDPPLTLTSEVFQPAEEDSRQIEQNPALLVTLIPSDTPTRTPTITPTIAVDVRVITQTPHLTSPTTAPIGVRPGTN